MRTTFPPSHVKLPASPVLVIAGVTSISSETIQEGYQNSENITDDKGNVATVVLSQYGITVQFTGLLNVGERAPRKGDSVALTSGDITFPTAHLSDVSIASTATGPAVVSGTVSGYAKLSSANTD